MKILLVNKYHYLRGGSETYYFGLAELLKRAGHEVIFFAMQDERNISCDQSGYFVSNVEFNGVLSTGDKIKAGLRMVYSLEAKRKMGKLLDDEKPDVVHINLFHRVLTASIVDAIKQRNIPIVFTMHDLNCICPNHTMLAHGKICTACLRGNYLHCVRLKCFKDSRAKCTMAAIESGYNKVSGLYDKLDLIITPSDFYRDLLIQSGLTHKTIVHMKNFLPFETNYHVSGRGDYVLYYGRLSYEKGIETLVRAMCQVNANLRIVGTGPMEPAIRDLIAAEKLEQKVELLGFQRGEKLKQYIENAACVIVPSEWYEASGYTACEAQAAGKPVVVTNAGGLPENIIPDVTGFLCQMFSPGELAQAINRILCMDDGDYSQMAYACVENARQLFDAEKYSKALTEHYEQLIKGRLHEHSSL